MTLSLQLIKRESLEWEEIAANECLSCHAAYSETNQEVVAHEKRKASHVFHSIHKDCLTAWCLSQGARGQIKCISCAEIIDVRSLLPSPRRPLPRPEDDFGAGLLVPRPRQLADINRVAEFARRGGNETFFQQLIRTELRVFQMSGMIRSRDTWIRDIACFTIFQALGTLFGAWLTMPNKEDRPTYTPPKQDQYIVMGSGIIAAYLFGRLLAAPFLDRFFQDRRND